MKNLSRSPFLWISATALSGMLYFFAFHFFPQTFPIINLTITMDLEQALEQANTIAQKHNLGPSDYHSAAMFHTDNTVKTFVELEAGGKDAFVTMMDDLLYMPYTWKVRHFKEHEKNETTIIFTPNGRPYGFVETISENTPGAQLSEKDAREIAEKIAVTNWNIDFTNYALVEASQKIEISKRIDHTFVYERTDAKIGNGTYRLKIVVSGDTVTELTHFVKVPEAFTRRYNEMRSANIVVAFIASLIVLLLYFLGGGVIGLYWIIRKRWYLLKQPLLCAFILALLSVFASANQLPFLWMQYNSTFSINSFLVQLFLTFLISFIGQTAAYTFIIMAAESLTRRAFGNHPQLWSVFSAENSSTYAIAGRTLGGYLLVGFNVAFVIAFYMLSLRYLGWWSPAEMLFDPNILATYAPWFSPLALSLNAGFIEECLFRAIPLAGAALLGSHFGKRNWWIAAAFILQAIVFGAAHANYPVQPSYARLIELLIPSCIWGAIYLRFGLLTNIIAHVVYDIIWLSIPIFISYSSDTSAYKGIIIIITLLPLLRVLYARLKKGNWSALPQSARNDSWQPSTASEEKHEETIETKATHRPTASSTKKSIFILGILGLVAWLCTTRFDHDGITITLNRSEAVTHANTFLEQKNTVLTAPWQTFPLMFTHYSLIAMQHMFIWKKGKKDLYHSLLGTYLEPAHWTIRYARFDTDSIQRAEEYKVMLYNHALYRYHHQLPESNPGASLTQQEARVIAHQAVRDQFNLDPTQLTEIAATQGQLPHRVNWLFIFADTNNYPLEIGQARISILISGDEVIDAARAIHVPEEWIRKEQNKQNMLNIIMLIFSLMVIFFLIGGLVIAARQKRSFMFSKWLFCALCGLCTTTSLINFVNNWPNLLGAFNTSMPFNTQLFQLIASVMVGTLITSVFYALILSYILLFRTQYTSLRGTWTTIAIGICSGLFVTGLLKGAYLLIPTNMPLWPSYDALCCTWPLFSSLLSSIELYVKLTTSFCLLFILIDTATAQWQKNRIFFTVVAALLGMAMINLPSLKMMPLWIIIGTAIGYVLLALYQHVMRYNYSLIPLATGSYIVLQLVQQGIFNAHPCAHAAAVINVCAIMILSLSWCWYTNRTNE